MLAFEGLIARQEAPFERIHLQGPFRQGPQMFPGGLHIARPMDVVANDDAIGVKQRQALFDVAD